MIRKAKPKRVFAFIDSQNLNVSVQRAGWKMDWRKFRKFLADEYGVTRAYMFIGYIPEHESLYEQMHQAGFMVVLKQTYDMTKPQNTDKKTEDDKHIKGNIDADLVLWAMKEMSNYDKAIIVSSDGDFFGLVEYLEQKGRLLNVLAPSEHYSSLYNKFDKYIVVIDKFKRRLAYHDRKASSKKK